jgi:hypothetical protein
LALAESRKKEAGEQKGTRTSGTCPHSGRGRAPVVIAGSLFLIGEIKRLRLF